MKRATIKIDQDKCVGCSLCVNACTQDALKLMDGKAMLVSEEYCDGLGMCLPQCPVDAIEIVQTEAEFNNESTNIKLKKGEIPSALKQWPVQLHLVRTNAEFFKKSNLLVAADCVGFALNNMHANLLENKSLVIACPKLDETSSYVEKLAKMFVESEIKTITVAIMEVPCCNGLDFMVQKAVELSGRDIPVKKVVVTIDGHIQ